MIQVNSRDVFSHDWILLFKVSNVLHNGFFGVFLLELGVFRKIQPQGRKNKAKVELIKTGPLRMTLKLN